MKKLFILFLWVLSFKFSYSQSWTPLPGGSLNGQPNTCISFGGYRWFSGSFSLAGALPSLAVARHNGTGWVPTPSLAGVAFSLCVWNNTLYGAGSFTVGAITYGAVKWNGTGWDYFGVIPSSDYFHTLTIFNNQLVFGGRGFLVDGIPINHLAKWDGSTWSALPLTITCSWLTLPNIRTVKEINGYLHVGGDLSDVNGVPTALAFKTDGTSVIPLSLEPNYYVSDFAEYQDSAFCTGNFPFGPFPANQGSPGIVKTNDVTWYQVDHGLKLRGLSLSSSPVGLYVGGQYINWCFNTPCNHADVGNLGLWNGSSWSNQSAGLFTDGNESVNFIYTDQLTNLTYAMGSFHTSRGDVADYVAVKTSYPLPVNLSSFTAQQSGNNVLLSWRDETPEDNVKFQVQVSNDGRDFRSIGQVVERGDKKDYNFLYPNPDCGKLFFRLHFENNYSKIVPLNTPCLGPKIIAGKQSLTIDTKLPGTLILTNLYGQTVLRTVLTIGTSQVSLVVPTGLYLARFINKNSSVSNQKVLIE